MNPEFAIIDHNILSCMGMQRLLGELIPMAEITVYQSYEELIMDNPERFVHYFVASSIYFENANFFISQPRKSIVLVNGNAYPHLNHLFTLNVCQDEKSLVRDLIRLQQMGHRSHGGGQHPGQAGPSQHPSRPPMPPAGILSQREIDVAILLAKGYINKEVAEQLNISTATVVTHRKNIMDKLHARSLADIIIHVVMTGLVTIDEL